MFINKQKFEDINVALAQANAMTLTTKAGVDALNKRMADLVARIEKLEGCDSCKSSLLAVTIEAFGRLTPCECCGTLFDPTITPDFREDGPGARVLCPKCAYFYYLSDTPDDMKSDNAVSILSWTSGLGIPPRLAGLTEPDVDAKATPKKKRTPATKRGVKNATR